MLMRHPAAKLQIICNQIRKHLETPFLGLLFLLNLCFSLCHIIRTWLSQEVGIFA